MGKFVAIAVSVIGKDFVVGSRAHVVECGGTRC